MNLLRLFNAQEALDEHITEKRNLNPEQLRDKKILAVFVELGELANEHRGFKFWSDRQTPKSPEYNFKPNKDGSELVAAPYDYKSYKLLEEYIDVLHFTLSLGNDIRFDRKREIYASVKNKDADVTEQFLHLFDLVNALLKQCTVYRYINFVQALLGLGQLLGFVEEEILSAYFKKHDINYMRQATGY